MGPRTGHPVCSRIIAGWILHAWTWTWTYCGECTMVSAPTTGMQTPTPRQAIGFQAAHAKSTSRMTDGHTLDDVKQLHSNGQCPDTIIDGA